MKIFDCNISYGFELLPGLKTFPDINSVLLDMDKHGISKCMLHSEAAKENEATLYNSKLVKDLKDCTDRIYGVYCFRPNLNGMICNPKEWANSIRENNIKGVYIYPNDFKLDIDHFYEYLQEFNRMKLPIFIEFAFGFGFAYKLDFALMHKLMSTFPDIPVVLTNAGMMNDSEVFRLATLHKNFYLEISGFQGNMAIEEFVSRFGSERLLFGSRAPFLSPISVIGKMYYSELADEDKQNIKYNNMQRLVDEVNYE